MSTFIGFIALLLAIPTYGISLVLWLFFKYQYDKTTATRVLINAIVMSYKNNGNNEVRYQINNAALSLVFDMYGGKILFDEQSAVSGILPHPVNKNILLVTMTQISDNRLLIKATDVNE